MDSLACDRDRAVLTVGASREDAKFAVFDNGIFQLLGNRLLGDRDKIVNQRPSIDRFDTGLPDGDRIISQIPGFVHRSPFFGILVLPGNLAGTEQGRVA